VPDVTEPALCESSEENQGYSPTGRRITSSSRIRRRVEFTRQREEIPNRDALTVATSGSLGRHRDAN